MTARVEKIAIEDVRRGDVARPSGHPTFKKVTETRLNTDTGSYWLWFGKFATWGQPGTQVEVRR